MKANVWGEYYDAVILQVVKPVTVDVSSADYTAEKLNKNTAAVDNTNGEQRPFIICQAQAVTLKVQTWKGDIITWHFTPGPYPMPLLKIFSDPANVLTADSTPITTIQIGY